MYKWQNKEQTVIEKISNGQVIPISHRLYANEVQAWVNEGNTIAPYATREELEAQAIQAIKHEASRQINTAYPAHKRENGNAYVTEINYQLQTVAGFALTAEQNAHITVVRAMKADIERIAAKSNEIEATLVGKIDLELEEIIEAQGNIPALWV